MIYGCKCILNSFSQAYKYLVDQLHHNENALSLFFFFFPSSLCIMNLRFSCENYEGRIDSKLTAYFHLFARMLCKVKVPLHDIFITIGFQFYGHYFQLRNYNRLHDPQFHTVPYLGLPYQTSCQ